MITVQPILEAQRSDKRKLVRDQGSLYRYDEFHVMNVHHGQMNWTKPASRSNQID